MTYFRSIPPRYGFLKFRAPDSGLSGPSSSPDQDYCVLLLGKTLKLSNCPSSPRGMDE